ncbi:hypothetical protein FDUTEX481_06856 [Tolypothrix sp. PCC 7601]|nr:hypothetical protein FDUTEX481_06856 [Tolypothrix sp. PCC 7601]
MEGELSSSEGERCRLEGELSSSEGESSQFFLNLSLLKHSQFPKYQNCKGTAPIQC